MTIEKNQLTTANAVREHASLAILALATLMRWDGAGSWGMRQSDGGVYALTSEDWELLILKARAQVELLAEAYHARHVQ